MPTYIYQNRAWPNFTWNEGELFGLLAEVRHLQGRIIGQMQAAGFETKLAASLQHLTMNVVKSSEIEGEKLNMAQVRSSLARKLGVRNEVLLASNKQIDGIVDMMLDATQACQKEITHKRLFGWHAALFPLGYSGAHAIEVGTYRSGEMQVVSGPIGRERVHFEAIPSSQLVDEMKKLLDWINDDQAIDPVLKAAIAHFWFIIIHPFDDGNGRIARALTDLLLARADGMPERFYSMSSQIMAERKEYYRILQEVQYSEIDITKWLAWFLNCLKKALLDTLHKVAQTYDKLAFWQLHEHTSLNARQRLILNKLLDGFEGKLQSSKWAKLAKCSADTALRDIKDLIDKRILQQEPSGGRSTNYELVPWQNSRV